MAETHASFVAAEVALCLIVYYPKWYRGKIQSIKHTDKVRGDLALDSIGEAVKIGLQIVVIDGKSSLSFRRELLQFDTLHVIKRKSVKRSPSKRLAIKKASKLPQVKAIILSEPEKISLISKCLWEIVEPIIKGEADIVIPKRSDQLFKSSYPYYMYESEVEGNKIYNEALRTHGLLDPSTEDLDMFFGPRVIRNDKKIIALFMRRYSMRIGRYMITSELFDPEEYSNAQFFPVIEALKKKYRVESIETSFTYPTIQKENEEVGAREVFLEKRRLQRLSLLVDLIHFLSYLDRKRTSNVKVLL